MAINIKNKNTLMTDAGGKNTQSKTGLSGKTTAINNTVNSVQNKANSVVSNAKKDTAIDVNSKQENTMKSATAPASTVYTPATPTISTGIINQSTWDVMNTPFAPSTAYNDAMNYTNGLLKQLSTGRTSYADQVDALMQKIQNREDFSYDADSDMLFQQYLSSMMQSGKTAMQDSIGQASALTGGYGSTYATTAGNQAYNAYLQEAYNNLPEYYQMAMEAYEMEGQKMFDELSMMSEADAREYDRLYNAWGANYNNAQQMYQNEYNAWQDGVANAFNSAGLQLQEQGQLFDQSYAYAKLAEDARQFDANMDYKNMAFAMEQANAGTAGTTSVLKQDNYTKALEAFNVSGEDGFMQYIDSMPSLSDEDLSALYQYVNTYGQLPVEQRAYEKVANNVVKDQYGNELNIDELPNIIREKLVGIKIGETYGTKKEGLIDDAIYAVTDPVFNAVMKLY